jgi:hypothetical protein
VIVAVIRWRRRLVAIVVMVVMMFRNGPLDRLDHGGVASARCQHGRAGQKYRC